MENIVLITDLKFKYNNKIVFNDFNVKIKKSKVTAIIGPNGSGKSTLIKLILGLLKGEGSIIVDGVSLKDNIREVRKNTGVVFSNPDNQFVAETVMDDIAFTLENMNFEKSLIKNKVLEVADYIGINDILDKNPHELSGGQKQLVAFASALVHDPKLLIFDEAFTMIDKIYKDKLFSLIKRLKKKGMSIIFVTHDIEDTLISDEIIVLNKGQVLLADKKEKIYKKEMELQELGFELPFMVEISNRLIFYDLIDKVHFDMEKLVDKLWS